ncbi:hypothetical protein BGV68_01860 [Burkholderia ubonensis]|nr:hypothetical protein BGV68_01860 [Burkholderia ubonensis]
MKVKLPGFRVAFHVRAHAADEVFFYADHVIEGLCGWVQVESFEIVARPAVEPVVEVRTASAAPVADAAA